MTINRGGTDINQFYGFELQPEFIPVTKKEPFMALFLGNTVL
jgi:hypothetical protein